MHKLRPFGLFAIVCAAAVCQPAQPVRAQTPSVLKDLADGKQLPQTIKLKDIKGDWQRMEASLATDVQNQMFSAMSGGATGNGDAFYTQGQTITLGNSVFLVAYRAQLKRPSFMEIIQGQGKKVAAEVLSLETPLTLTLLNFQHLGSITNLKPLDVAAEVDASKKQAAAADNNPVVVEARATAKGDASRSNLKQLGLAVMQFAQDANQGLPSMKSPAEFKKDLLPYVKADQVFVQPISNEPYIPNPFLNGKKVQPIVLNPGGDMLQTSEIILAYEATPTADGARNVAYLDGHVKQLSANEWTEGKAKSRIP